MNPKMGLANVSSRDGELVDTKYGKSHQQNLNRQQHNLHPASQVFALCTANLDPDRHENRLSFH